MTTGESTTEASSSRPATSRHDEILTERETVLRWDGHKDVVHLFTAAPTVYRKLCRAGYAPDRGEGPGMRVDLPDPLSRPSLGRPTPENWLCTPGFSG